MRLALIATVIPLVGGVFASTSLAADARWIRIQSPDFDIYSTANEASTRDTLKEFEQVRAFVISGLPIKDEKPLPVRFVQFGSDKEYQPYRLNPTAAAYYKSGAERDTIVMSRVGAADTSPAAIHEYVHLVVRHAGLNLPLWLNEGLAEFYTSWRQVSTKVVIGGALEGRLSELAKGDWVPLSAILAVNQTSPEYNEKDKTGRFYAESWALTHMLSLGPDYRSKWREFIKAVAAGTDSAEALSATYGKPVEAIEADLRRYVEGVKFLPSNLDAKPDKVSQKSAAAPAPAFDLKLMLLEIAVSNTTEQTQQQLQKLAQEEPSRPEPYLQLAYLAWSPGKPAGEEVRINFAKAYTLGDRSPRMLWDYSRLITSGQPAEAVHMLNELSALEPERRDVKIELAGAMLNAGQPDAAVETIHGLNGCTPAETTGCMIVTASAYLKLEQRDQAQNTAELFLKTAKTPEDRQQAQQLLDMVKRAPSAAKPVAFAQRPVAAPPVASPSAAATASPTASPSPNANASPKPVPTAAASPKPAPIANAAPVVTPPVASKSSPAVGASTPAKPLPVANPSSATSSSPAAGPAPAVAQRTVPEMPDHPSHIPLIGVNTVAGNFVEFVCADAKQFVIDTPAGKKRFILDDPQGIMITGRDSDSVNLTCGAQKPIAAVELGYIAAPAGSNADGLVRALYFGQ